ncbi:hypothetical protein SGL43_06587 [Streptomyces globisporus]|uniref:Uncharacterized protein n=1 Tax=Streptomyces globisporus TaxID=1908 RepID=A0ABN8V9N8_STRGL|nr:hypothetical protein [Streptomyces globisporus]WSF75159.1 hypothetical protein OG838_02890 [Streptomyces globisporus]CAH9419532.1 hypothetical protein SGL43_06587 [Streptomyces globisporus]
MNRRTLSRNNPTPAGAYTASFKHATNVTAGPIANQGSSPSTATSSMNDAPPTTTNAESVAG